MTQTIDRARSMVRNCHTFLIANQEEIKQELKEPESYDNCLRELRSLFVSLALTKSKKK